MAQTFKTEEDYVRYRLIGFRPNRKEEVCETFHEEGERPSIGAWVHDEGYFQEYIHTCQECYDASLESIKAFFHDPNSDTNWFICEDCDVYFERFVKNEDGSLTDNLYIHKDVEDKSLTYCCETCYDKRKEADKAFWEDY